MQKNTDNLKRDLAKILFEKSYLEGDFTLTSGRKSDYYFDCRQSSLNPAGAFLIGSLFFEMLKPFQPKAVAGMTMGADPLVTATSVVAYTNGLHLPALIVRKEPKGHGTGRSIEGLANVTVGDSVIMLEDVISTGGSVIKACELVRSAGFKVDKVFCILNRQEGAEEKINAAGCTVHSIFTRQELVSLAKN